MATEKNHVEGLDSLRGFAATAVAVFHCNALLALQPWTGIWAVARHFYVAVSIFFALSAFALCLGYFGRLQSREQIGTFFIRRVLRIVPLFYFMLAVWVVRMMFYGQPVPIDQLILNLTFTFPFAPGLHESLVLAGWSIGVEMLFYLALPILLFCFRNLREAILGFAAVLIFALTYGYIAWKAGFPRQYDWMNVASQLPFFMGGIVCYFIFQQLKDRDPARRATIAAVLIALSAVATELGHASGAFWFTVDGWPAGRHLLGLAMLPLVFAFAIFPFRLLVNPATVYIGKVSYGIYLIHPLVILQFGAPTKAYLQSAGFGSFAVTALVMVMVLALTTALATATYYLFERRFSQLRWSWKRSAPLPAVPV